jgi:hypothetical protein
MQNSPQREKILRNFRKHSGQFQVDTTDVRVYAKLSPEQVYEYMRNAIVPCRHQARELLRKMSENEWTIASHPKTGGRDPSAPLHITIRVPPNRSPAYHLNCRAVADTLSVYAISDKRLGDRSSDTD